MAFVAKFDAVIFDLDGVITKTALVHASAWKKMFDEFMRDREESLGEAFREFTHAGDYLPYVDGKPRYKGVASFLESRGIDIPFGDPEDEPEKETVCGLGNRKNIMFNEVLDEEGVECYESTVELLEGLKQAGVRIGVASSSKNCKPVLEKAGLMHYFETRVDGVVSAEIGLNGKPEPDIFTTACDNLGVSYHRSVVVEDAVSGVQAGKKGNFGLTLGVARENNVNELYIGGADVVVEDLAEMGLEGINRWFEKGMDEDAWKLRFADYSLQQERSREALLTVGNGYFGTRGALEESRANEVNYPGTYVSGLFNRLVSKVAGRDVENEDFVNLPNWLPFSFRIGEGPWLNFGPECNVEILSIRRSLDMKQGVLERELMLKDDEGRISKISSRRFAGMDQCHKGGISYVVTPMNYGGRIQIRSQLSGNHKNAGVPRYNDLEQQHLVPVSTGAKGDHLKLVVRTSTSGITIALVAKHLVSGGSQQNGSEVKQGEGWIAQTFSFDSKQGEEIRVEKLVSLYTSRDPGINDPENEALMLMNGMGSFSGELSASATAWSDIWERVDVRIEGDREAQRLVRMHLFHMWVSASPHHAGLDAGIGPRGLHGEAYRGHIFWDELYMLPLYNLYFPEVSRSVLMYRYKRLDAARAYAREYGYQGAMFPWQSGSDGREETQIIHLNPLSGEWGDDYSSLQRHISLAIAYNLWTYFHDSGDLDFMEQYGSEILLEICKFWISKAQKDEASGRYHIRKVMGPDEFHEKLPEAEEGGLSDNAYSNMMVCWMLGKAFRILELVSTPARKRLMEDLSLTEADLVRWKEVMHSLALRMDDQGVIEQFEGYFSLEELDWEYYKQKYPDIHRLDRILKAEGRSPDDYKLAKQADLLMIFYNLGSTGVSRILDTLSCKPPGDYMEKNFDYYIQRTSHGSTLSKLVHGRLSWQMGRKDEGWALFLDALRSDLVDVQGGTTGEGIHCGVMAGTVCDVIYTFGGLDLHGDIPSLEPSLPGHWGGLQFGFMFKGSNYQVEISQHVLKICLVKGPEEKKKVHLCGREVELEAGLQISVEY